MAAAARLGAFGAGFGDTKASCRALYSSVPLESFYERDRGEKNSSGQNHNSLNRQSVRRRCSRRPGSKGYGVALSNAETARERFQRRRRLIERRLKIAVIHCGRRNTSRRIWSNRPDPLFLPTFCESSVILLTLLRIYSSLGITGRRFRFYQQILVKKCSQQLSWPNLGLVGARLDRRVYIPVHVLMTIPMFLRLYLVGRFMVLHSATHQDSSTVYATNNSFSNAHYFLDYIWFEVVTFFAIGRTVAIATGIVGTITSSLLTVLVSQKMLLSLSERRVNQVVAESQLGKLHKHEAARVLQ
uniref:Potassium channel domain-containing protein n=1 Tax=Ditylenchus dipsaci TaxID=166011 RepID=A0A915DZT3_9BILA